MGRSLKNYDNYLDKLKIYAEACDITVEYRDYDGDGGYIPSRRKIVLDKDLPESTEIATFIHELGHSLDDALYDSEVCSALDDAYNKFYKQSVSAEEVEMIYECESRAWALGRGIAKKLRIPLGKWFDEEQTEALEDYGSYRNA